MGILNYVTVITIVSCCCRLITEDAESGLFAVTIFRKVLDEYKLHCRENKLVSIFSIQSTYRNREGRRR